MLKNISEVTATFDGVSYTLTVDHDLREYEWEAMIGSSDPSYNDYPFLFIADVNTWAAEFIFN